MEITEKWLGDIGGWQALKAARALVEAGKVTLGNADAGLIRGLAGHGKTQFACGLRIKTRSDVENLCACPASRRGMICDHSLAVALVWLKPQSVPAPRPPAAPSLQPQEKAPVRTVQRVAGSYTVFLPESLLTSGLREPVSAYIKYSPDGEGEESLLVSWLAEQGIKAQSAPLSLPSASLPGFLESLAGHPRLIAGKPSGGGTALSMADAPVRLPVTVEALGDQVKIGLLGAGQRPLVKTQPLGRWLCPETAVIFPLPPDAGQEIECLLAEMLTAATSRPLRWFVTQRAVLDEVFQIEMRGAAQANFHIGPVPCEFQIHLDGSFQAAEISLVAEFQGQRWAVGMSPSVQRANASLYPIQDQHSTSTFYIQNTDGESRLFPLLLAYGFRPEGVKLGPQPGEVWRLTGPENVMRFYASDLPRLRQICRVIEGDKWRAATQGIARIVPQTRTRPAEESTSGSDWLAMEFAYAAPDGFRLPRAEVLRLVRSGQRSVQGKNGKRYLLDLQGVEEFEDTLRDVPLQLTPDGARISSLHAHFFSETDNPASLPADADTLAHLGDLGPRLRPYQLLGVRWMTSLSGKGGLLGDEMGLGKTVQSIALISGRYSQTPEAGRLPVLIVCPKSLTGNWCAEFERFAPHLKVAISQGAGRGELLKRLAAQNVIITTYQLIVRDYEIIKKQSWSLILLDEASYIRNPDTDAAKALCGLRAETRLALTGTPVENTTRDLWSIYRFLLPGYLGSKENFKERFEHPLQSSPGSPAAQAASDRLKKLLRPYFLRRTKREVLRDLPEKIEQILWCDPTPAQAEVYRRLLEEGREEIKTARKRSGQGGARMTMLTVLLRLRQACCDLRLTGLGKDTLGSLERDDLSGKWPMLMERLEEIQESGGKVLIFSQFVQYLRLVREALDAQKLPYCYLDGSSQDREAQVRTFQTDPARRAFLISLKTGGYGLNLTAADHVILLDPWWNPAVEAQAIDRAHRIGQQRIVTAYRLAMRGTVEERILALQTRKRGLVEAAIDDHSPLMAGLLEADIEELIA